MKKEISSAGTRLNIGFIYTSHCNAVCRHCSTDCGPKKRDYLSEAAIEKAIGEAHAISGVDQLQVCFSGGEPFVDLAQLERLVSVAKKHSAIVTCVTNGFWATSAERATEVLRPLKLDAIALSASEFHSEFIAPDRVKNAIRAAKDLGIGVVLKFPFTAVGQNSEEWAKENGVDLTDVELETFPLMPYIRTGETISKENYELAHEIPDGTCPGSVLTVREDGNAYTCCTPGGFIEPLRVGNLDSFSVEEIHSKYSLDGILQLLRIKGPSYFVPHIKKEGLGKKLGTEFSGICDLCIKLMSDKDLYKVCRRIADEYEIEQISDWLGFTNPESDQAYRPEKQ